MEPTIGVAPTTSPDGFTLAWRFLTHWTRDVFFLSRTGRPLNYVGNRGLEGIAPHKYHREAFAFTAAFFCLQTRW